MHRYEREVVEAELCSGNHPVHQSSYATVDSEVEVGSVTTSVLDYYYYSPFPAGEEEVDVDRWS